MSKVFVLTQTTTHRTVVRADDLEQAQEYLDGLGDDDFKHVNWGDENIEVAGNGAPVDLDISTK